MVDFGGRSGQPYAGFGKFGQAGADPGDELHRRRRLPFHLDESDHLQDTVNDIIQIIEVEDMIAALDLQSPPFGGGSCEGRYNAVRMIGNPAVDVREPQDRGLDTGLLGRLHQLFACQLRPPVDIHRAACSVFICRKPRDRPIGFPAAAEENPGTAPATCGSCKNVAGSPDIHVPAQHGIMLTPKHPGHRCQVNNAAAAPHRVFNSSAVAAVLPSLGNIKRADGTTQRRQRVHKGGPDKAGTSGDQYGKGHDVVCSGVAAKARPPTRSAVKSRLARAVPKTPGSITKLLRIKISRPIPPDGFSIKLRLLGAPSANAGPWHDRAMAFPAQRTASTGRILPGESGRVCPTRPTVSIHSTGEISVFRKNRHWHGSC